MYNPSMNEGCDLKILGVGGAGSSIVSHMLAKGISGAQFIVMNTDNNALTTSPCQNKVLLGHGDQGRSPSLGRQSVLESHDDVVDAICDARLLILVGGLGGNTATGALPLIARMAKDMDIFVVCLVTKPFAFEGTLRAKRAQEAVANLANIADNVVAFENDDCMKGRSSDKLFSAVFENTNEALFEGARYIAGLLDNDTSDMDDEDFHYIRFYISNHDFICKSNMEKSQKEPDTPVDQKLSRAKSEVPHICRENLGRGCVCEICGTICHTLEDDDQGFGTGLVHRWCTRCNAGIRFYGDTGTTVSGGLWPDGYDARIDTEWTRADYLRAITKD